MDESVNYIYIGPTIARIGLKRSTLVIGAEPPPQLKSLIELKPIIRALFVPTSKTMLARINMQKRGTIEYAAAEEVLNYAKEKAAKERQVGKEL